MSRTSIAELCESDLVGGTYLVSQKQLATTKTGKPYLKLRLQDRTGEIEARVWDSADILSGQFDVGDVVHTRGTVEAFQGQLQMRLDDIRRVPPDEINPADFLPASRYDIDEMWNRLLGIVKDIKNPHIKDLLHEILTDPEFAKLFKKAPAAKGIHHPWIGGLLEHVLSLCHLARRVCPHYPHIDQDQVVFGCIMHDMGKVWELSYDRNIGYTDEGRLVGHLVMGIIQTDRAISRRKDFPPELALRLKHILAAHHGQYEFGSPKLPQTLEAELVHRLDDLDSKITAITETLNNVDASEPRWSNYNRSMGRSFFRGEEEPDPWADKMVALPEESGKGDETAVKTAKPRKTASLDLFEKPGKRS